MRGDALKHLSATALAGIEPTEAELRNGLADGIDMLLAAASLGERMTAALEKLAGIEPPIDG